MKPFKRTRRRFLSDITGVGMALSLGKFHTPLLDEVIEPSSLFGSKNMELGSKILLFSKQLEWITDYNELCELAGEVGFDGFELTVRPGGHVLPERVEDDLPRAVEAARKAGVEISMITTQITDPRDSLTEKIIKTASELNIRYYRMGGLNYNETQSIEQTLKEYKPIFRDLSEINQQYQIHGAYQNHAGSNRISASIWDLWFLLQGLDSRWIGCQYDTRHSQLEGGSWWPVGLRLLSPYIKTSVVKDFKWIQEKDQILVQNCPIGEGVVDLQNYFSLVKKNDIKAPISLHFPYSLIEDSEKLRKKKRIGLTISAMKQKGINPLKIMLQQAGLT